MSASCSDNESDFASAESDAEPQEGGVKTLVENTTGSPIHSETVPEQNSSSTNPTDNPPKVLEDEPSTTNKEINKETPSIPSTSNPHEHLDDINQSPSDDPPVKSNISTTPTPPDSKDTDSKFVTRSSNVTNKESANSDGTGSSSGGGGGGGGWGMWGGWGGSLWSSVSTVAESAQAIGQKVTSVIASVEDSLGVPSPEELAQEGTEGHGLDQETCRLADDMVEHDVPPEDLEPVKDEPHHQDEAEPLTTEALSDSDKAEPGQNQAESNFGAVSGFFSGFAAAVQTTSQGLVTGGLDALETLGKKTMKVLSEGDPGLARKKAMLGMGPSSTLSQLLLEAKAEGAAREAAAREGDTESTSTPLNYSRLFDEYHGVGHLEALELLSKEYAAKAHGISGKFNGSDLQSFQEKLEQLSEAFAIDEEQSNLDDDDCQLEEVKELFSSMTLPLKADKLIKVSDGWREKVKSTCREEDDKDVKEDDKDMEENINSEDSQVDNKVISEVLYENGLRSLAELTSTSIELFRKMAEVSLLPDISNNDPILQAQKLNRLTLLVSNELDALASVHSEAITKLNLEGTNSNVTSLYLESSNSGSYVQDAFQLLLPVLKFSLMQQLKVQEPHPNTLNRN